MRTCFKARVRSKVRTFSQSLQHWPQESLGVLDGLDNDADLEVFEFTEYGREFMKSCKCSPDVWLQLALQV